MWLVIQAWREPRMNLKREDRRIRYVRLISIITADAMPNPRPTPREGRSMSCIGWLGRSARGRR